MTTQFYLIITSCYPRSTTDVCKGYFYKHQVDFFGSRRCLRRPGFDSYFAPIIKFIRPDYYQCFLSNRDIMVFFGQLTVFLSLDLFCCYGCRACFFGTSQHITCSQSVFASVVPHQDQPIFPCQLWKKSISPWASKMMPAVATKLAPEAEATTNAGPDLWKATVCPHNHLFRLTPHGGWWGIKLATTTQAKPGWHVGVEFVMRTSPRHEINHVEAERQTQIVGLQALDSGTGWPESIDGDDFFMRAGVWEQQSIDISQLIFFTMRTSAAESKSSPLATLPLDRRTQVITRFESSFPTQLLGERLLFFFMSRLRKEIII